MRQSDEESALVTALKGRLRSEVANMVNRAAFGGRPSTLPLVASRVAIVAHGNGVHVRLRTADGNFAVRVAAAGNDVEFLEPDAFATALREEFSALLSTEGEEQLGKLDIQKDKDGPYTGLTAAMLAERERSVTPLTRAEREEWTRANPWLPATKNFTKQMQIEKRDVAFARTLMAAAGVRE